MVNADQLDLTLRNAPDERGDEKSRFSRIAVIVIGPSPEPHGNNQCRLWLSSEMRD